MDGDAADTADSPIPTTEPTQTEGTSSITDEQWKALQNVLKDVYAYRPEPYVVTACVYSSFCLLDAKS